VIPTGQARPNPMIAPQPIFKPIPPVISFSNIRVLLPSTHRSVWVGRLRNLQDDLRDGRFSRASWSYRGASALGTLMRFLPIITQIFSVWAIF